MTARQDFQTLLVRNRRRMDAERREFAERAVEVVARNGERGPVFGMVAYALTMRELEGLLSEFYGSNPYRVGGRFGQLILEECRDARALAFQRSVQDVRRRLPRAMVRIIEDTADGP